MRLVSPGPSECNALRWKLRERPSLPGLLAGPGSTAVCGHSPLTCICCPATRVLWKVPPEQPYFVGPIGQVGCPGPGSEVDLGRNQRQGQGQPSA